MHTNFFNFSSLWVHSVGTSVVYRPNDVFVTLPLNLTQTFSVKALFSMFITPTLGPRNICKT